MLLLMLSLVLQAEPAHVRCATSTFHRIAVERPEPRTASKRSASAPLVVGEQRTLWLYDMTVMPPAQWQTQVTVRGVGRHCYVMVEDSAWDAGLLDSAKVARIIDRFDESSPRDSTRGVWDHSTAALGDPPDEIDNDSLIYLIYYNIGTYRGRVFDGFWMSFDEYYDSIIYPSSGYHSNEIECVYLDCHPDDPSSDYRVAIAAHEFAHMIHWNYDQSESLWVTEGCAELVMQLFGAPDPISGFPGRSDNDLTLWTGAWADYIKTYLWFLFLNEHYAELGANDLIRNIVASPAVSIAGINEGFAQTGIEARFDEVLDHWVLTNLINDTTVFDGRFGYYGDQVPRFTNSGVHLGYPVNRSADLSRWAGEYVYFGMGSNLELEFDGADAADFRLFLVGKDTIRQRAMLDTLTLDSLQRASASVPGFGTDWQIVWIVPANHTPAGRMSYSYSASATGLAESRHDAGLRPLPPTIVRAGQELRLPPEIRIYAADGRLVGTDTRQLAPGVYFVGRGANPSLRLRFAVVR